MLAGVLMFVAFAAMAVTAFRNERQVNDGMEKARQAKADKVKTESNGAAVVHEDVT